MPDHPHVLCRRAVIGSVDAYDEYKLEIRCGNPESIRHAAKRVIGHSYKSKTIYTCELGYEQTEGSAVSACLESGEWNTTSFHCEKIFCGLPKQLPHTQMTTDSLDYLSKATYMCEQGYTPTVGVATTQCTAEGTWTSVSIDCHPITCSLDTLQQTHVTLTESIDNHFGALVTLSCDRDYKLVSGSVVRRCLADGSWSGEKLTCKVATCHHPVDNMGCITSPY
ncbi:hypothetical protein LSAT2_033111 [Lamellibrachia satsuma]|nr:hypothetical protein LSAT2_033111 [Lamellibrachia satsuma]